MGATVVGNTIYISKDLKLTPSERRVVIAHELGHCYFKHRLILLPVVLLFFWYPAIINAVKRYLEIQADLYALDKTKDYASFVSLMDKLQHNKSNHPTKEARVRLALQGNK